MRAKKNEIKISNLNLLNGNYTRTLNGRTVMTNRSEIVTNFCAVVLDAWQFCAFVGSASKPYCNMANNSKQCNRMMISFKRAF